MKNNLMGLGVGAMLVIILISGAMIPFITEFNDNIVEKNSNPIGNYMLKGAGDNNSNITIEINSSGTYVNDYDVSTGYHVVIMDKGLITLYNGSIGIVDMVNGVHVTYDAVGTTLELKNGNLKYSLNSTEYTMTYENVLYPTSKGNYSAYGNNTIIHASIDDEVYMVSQEPGSQPRLVATYTNGVRTNVLGPVTISNNAINNYTGNITYTVPAQLAEDGKSWIYSGTRSAVIGGDTPYTLNTVFIAPNTYDTIGKMGMVITLTELIPLLIGIAGFIAMGIYLVRQRI